MIKYSTFFIPLILNIVYTFNIPLLIASENLPLQSLLTKESKPIDSGFLISASDIQSHKKINGQKDYIFIDIRNSDLFQKVRISGSINVQLFAIKTKVFLKTKQLVLVNEGFGYKNLIQECRRLRKKGFKSVHILKGGLNAWQKSGGYIEGNYFAKKDLNIIKPHSFFQDKNYENIIVINIYRLDSPEPKALIPETINIPFSGNTSRLIDDLKETILSSTNDDLLYIMISDGYNLISNYIKEIDKNISDTIFYFKGGTQEYKQFLKKQALIWEPKKQIKTGKRCNVCN